VLEEVPELDVIAHQDGVANHNSLENATAFLAALHAVVKGASPPRQLWSDVEAFDTYGDRFVTGIYTLEDAIRSHACSLEALACVWLSSSRLFTHLIGWHCKFRPPLKPPPPPPPPCSNRH
jgi:hypothetical protein